MTAIVERVAKAVEAEWLAIATEAMRGGGIGFSRTDRDHIRIAQAAMRAMREPTSKMLAAAALSAVDAEVSEQDKIAAGGVLELLPPTGHPDGRTIIAEIARDYRAMIDAALAEASK